MAKLRLPALLPPYTLRTPEAAGLQQIRDRQQASLSYFELHTSQFIIDTIEPMKCHRKELWFNTSKRVEFIRITDHVQEAIAESGIQEGMVLVNAMHITASVFINDNESGLWNDFEGWLENLAPHAPINQYRHNDTGEDNADAHLKRTIMGRETVVAITKGKLDLGPWEEIFYGEFDGRRPKRALIKIIGE